MAKMNKIKIETRVKSSIIIILGVSCFSLAGLIGGDGCDGCVFRVYESRL